MYYCNGKDFDVGVVPGRIGAGQTSGPYKNPFPAGGYCRDACTPQDMPHQDDGYKACYGWNHVITVWRNAAMDSLLSAPPPPSAPGSFSATTPYFIQPVNGGGSVALGIPSGSTTNGAQLQQLSGSADSQKFNIVSTGNGNYKITMRSASNKCLDHAKSNVDGVRLTTWDCNGGTNQQWQIVPDQQAGVYELKNVWSGRCMDEPAGSTRSGLQMQGWTCTTGNANQRYFIKPAS